MKLISQGFQMIAEGDSSAGTVSGALISLCGLYRYKLWREWAPGRTIAFVGLNPSTADATVDDPTIRRCVGFAKREGFGRLVMLNLFAFRATDPRALERVRDPWGPDNAMYVTEEATQADLVVACWGSVSPRMRNSNIRDLLEKAGVDLHCFGWNKDGSPRHPLYLKANTPIVRMHRWPCH